MNLLSLFKHKEKRAAAIEIPVYSASLPFGLGTYNQTSMNISAVYRAVGLISDSIAILPIQIKSKGAIVDSHPLNLVFKKGLNYLTKYSFMKLLVQSVLLRGNGYAYIERADDGTVISLMYLDDVSVQYNKRKRELYYTSPTIGSMKIEPCNMIHLIKNTYDGIKGVPVITYASRSLHISNSTENSANNFFQNGCNLSGVLTVQGQLTSKQREDIRASWNQAYSSGGNGLAVLQGNMEYKPVQLSARESQMLESRLFNVQDIARFFEISPVLLGDLSHSTYTTIEASQQDFLLHTLQPYITMIEEEFGRKLIKPSESDLSINLEEKYILRTDKNAQTSYYNTLLSSGILSINEVRKELGYEPIENGDKHFIPYTDIKQNTIDKQDEENL